MKSLLYYYLISVLVLLSHFASSSSIGKAAEYKDTSSSWTVLTIDDVDWGYYVHHSDTSIAVDSSDHIHLSYRGPDYNIRYATNLNSCWSSEVVYNGDKPAARENSIATDSGNYPHISFSYSDGHAEDLKYAKNIMGTWQIDTIDTTNSAGMENDIAVDGKTNIHISHWEWNNNELRYSTTKTGAWTTEVISNADWDRTAIAIDNNNYVHIAYSHNEELKYTTNSTGTWTFTIIDNQYGGEPSIAIDSNNKVHISYSSDNNLKYTTNISGTWRTTTIASGFSVDRNHSIAVDTNNKVHISYYDPTNSDLKYTTNLTGTLETYTIDSTGFVGRSNSITVDSNNCVHISYRDDNISPNKLYNVWGTSSSDVFAVGEGTILHYDGNVWSRMDSEIIYQTENIEDVWGSSASDVFAVGENGTFLHYNGSTWNTMTTSTTYNLYGVWGSSASDVFAVGENGTILHYNGSTWNTMTTSTTYNLYGIWGSSASDVFAVGENGIILHYNGNEWSNIDSGLTYDKLTDIWGSTPNSVFVVSESGRVLYYDGIMWKLMNTGRNEVYGWISDSLEYYGIWGSSSNDVFVMSSGYHNYGQIIHYGGNSWNAMLSAKLKYTTNSSSPIICLQTPTPTQITTPMPTPSPFLCVTETILVSPSMLTIKRKKSGKVTVIVTGEDSCKVEGETVTATISAAGKSSILVSPSSAVTDANGQATFTITATKKTGNASVTFQASNVKKSISVNVKK